MPAANVASPKTLRGSLSKKMNPLRSGKAASTPKRMGPTAVRGSFYELARKYIGAAEGPGDLSVRSKAMEGYGLSRRS